jgi:hypothetical protein
MTFACGIPHRFMRRPHAIRRRQSPWEHSVSALAEPATRTLPRLRLYQVAIQMTSVSGGSRFSDAKQSCGMDGLGASFLLTVYTKATDSAWSYFGRTVSILPNCQWTRRIDGLYITYILLRLSHRGPHKQIPYSISFE